MSIDIDKNIAIPPRTMRRAGAPRKYPLFEMAVGDSFFVPKPQASIGGSIAHAKKRSGFSFTARSVTENDVEGTRIWRIK